MAIFKIDGMRKLEKTFQKLGKVPQTVATKAARAGATVALRATRANIPEGETGELKKGLILKKERRTVQGKAVYDVRFDPKKNEVFVKTSKAGKRSYYPASQEYGFLTKSGGYVPGYRFMRRGITEHRIPIITKMVSVAGKEIDKALRG